MPARSSVTDPVRRNTAAAILEAAARGFGAPSRCLGSKHHELCPGGVELLPSGHGRDYRHVLRPVAEIDLQRTAAGVLRGFIDQDL